MEACFQGPLETSQISQHYGIDGGPQLGPHDARRRCTLSVLRPVRFSLLFQQRYATDGIISREKKGNILGQDIFSTARYLFWCMFCACNESYFVVDDCAWKLWIIFPPYKNTPHNLASVQQKKTIHVVKYNAYTILWQSLFGFFQYISNWDLATSPWRPKHWESVRDRRSPTPDKCRR